ncbi:MAG: sigma-E factor negative regulatory protein [Bdellovibrionales bacterium]|nr:sigma-E factor negative regulatory protein [Ramlibacter sp.]
MNHDLMKNRELISALADGQLRGADFARTVELTAVDEDAQSAWQVYHLVGDVLRSTDLASRASNTAFMVRLNTQLARENVPSAAAVVATAPSVTSSGVDHGRAPAANQADIRWKLVAGFASMAAVAAIGWGLLGNSNTSLTQSQLAQVGVAAPQARADAAQVAQQVTVAGRQQVMIRDARLDELMSAHRQFGGTSALQMPAGFMRNATFEGPAR